MFDDSAAWANSTGTPMSPVMAVSYPLRACSKVSSPPSMRFLKAVMSLWAPRTIADTWAVSMGAELSVVAEFAAVANAVWVCFRAAPSSATASARAASDVARAATMVRARSLRSAAVTSAVASYCVTMLARCLACCAGWSTDVVTYPAATASTRTGTANTAYVLASLPKVFSIIPALCVRVVGGARRPGEGKTQPPPAWWNRLIGR